MKITFMGAGSTVFAKNVLGDVLLTPALCECEIALYDEKTGKYSSMKGIKVSSDENVTRRLEEIFGSKNVILK